MKDIWLPGLLVSVALFCLEFLDGVLFLAAVDIDERMMVEGTYTAFAIICLCIAVFTLFASTYLLRKLRYGQKLSQDKETR